MLKYSIADENKGSINVTNFNDVYTFYYPCESNYDCTPYQVSIKKGRYLVECWGAAGGIEPFHNYESKGAYVSGILNLQEETKFFFYIGGKGSQSSINNADKNHGGYNGGGDGYQSGSGGGGGTDIRLNKSYYSSRIIVAGGGGGGERAANGHGGGLDGIKGQETNCDTQTLSQGSSPGTQTNGGQGGGYNEYGYGESGGFGYGGSGYSEKDGGPGGGGGYFGGGGLSWVCAASGGSSYISGMKGCYSVPSENSEITENNPIHYSQIKFTSPVMISGNLLMPSYYFNDQMQAETFPEGNKGSGAIKITILTISTCVKKIKPSRLIHISIIICFVST